MRANKREGQRSEPPQRPPRIRRCRCRFDEPLMVRGNDLDRRSKAQVDLITKRRLSGDVGGNIYVCIYNVEIDFILFSGEVSKEEGV